MARVIRSNNQNVSPSDDASLYRTIYDDGLFESATITSAGAALVNISALYGILEGRDFTTEAMQITVELPSSGTDTGSIVVRFDTTTDTVISIVSGLDYALTYEDINATGTICEMEIATYTASATAVTAITSTYNIINPHTLTECGDLIGTGSLSTTASTLTGAINEIFPTLSGVSNKAGVAVLGNLLFEWGAEPITPSAANTPTKTTVTFTHTFAQVPVVITTPYSSVAGTTVLGTAALNTSTTTTEIYVTRTNTTDTIVSWLAIGQIA